MINDDDVEVMCGVSIAQFGFTGIEATLLNILQVMRKKINELQGVLNYNTVWKSLSSKTRLTHSSLLAVHTLQECIIIGNQWRITSCLTSGQINHHISILATRCTVDVLHETWNLPVLIKWMLAAKIKCMHI